MSFVSLYLYVPDEGSLLPKYRDCTTSNDFELYIYIHIYIELETVVGGMQGHAPFKAFLLQHILLLCQFNCLKILRHTILR